jgi:restriction endonuclease S subunit
MRSDWQQTALGNLLELANGKTSPERQEGLPYPVYGSNGIIGFADEFNAFPDTIIIGRVGSYCGSLQLSQSKCWVTDNAIHASASPGHNPIYLYYLLSNLDLNNWRTGSGQPLLNQTILNSIEVIVPPLPEQRAIAHILGSLDDKIELNRRMNAALEGIARALFKSWFVDFDPVYARRGERESTLPPEVLARFPDDFEESEMGPIPAGWKVVKVKALGSLDHNRLTPQDYAEETFDYFSIPAYKESGMPELEVGAEIKSSKYLVPEGSVLLSRLNPRFPRVWLPFLEGEYRAICSTEFLVVMPKAGASREYLYTLFNMDNFRHRFEHLVTGTSGSHQRVKQRSFLSMRVVKPHKSVVELFTRIAKPIYEKIAQNQFEFCTLAELRDTLLPRLISGELRVP